MERYARLSLIYCFDKSLSLLQKGEEPDWQSTQLGIGLEVTEALSPQDGRKRNAINQYFGKGMNGHDIKQQFDKKYPEYAHHLRVIENTACFSDFYDMHPKIQQICSTIQNKTVKLNGNYKKFKENWLYVFAPDLFDDTDISQVLQAYQKTSETNVLTYDKLFLNAQQWLFVLQPDGLKNKILLSEQTLIRLKREAQQ